jgi:hypothetical protein
MLLSAALFALFMMGFWLYCLTDAILTPAAECRGLRKPTWITLIAATFIGGAVAWLIVRRPARDSSVPLMPLSRADGADADDDGYLRNPLGADADHALARHPAGRARITDAASAAPKGPDDDQEFLRALDRAIRRNPPVS